MNYPLTTDLSVVPHKYRILTTCSNENNRTLVTKTVTTVDANGNKTVTVYINGVEQPAGTTAAQAQAQALAQVQAQAQTQGQGQTGNQTASSSPPQQQAVRKLDIPKFEKDSVTEHNKFRAKHGCPPLKLSRELCNLAKEWAENLAKRNAMEHRPNNKYGENIYMSGGVVVEAINAVKAWYDEIEYYNFDKEENDISKVGHFTQLVWKQTTEMGIAIVEKGKSTWVVANYSPHGNTMTKFKENVPKLQ